MSFHGQRGYCTWAHSVRDIHVDQVKVEVISALPHSSNYKEICGFLGHATFYRRFIKDFAKVAQPLTSLLQNDVEFDFDDACNEASAMIIHAPNLDYLFEAMWMQVICSGSCIGPED